MTSSFSNTLLFLLHRALSTALAAATGLLLGLFWAVWARVLETWCGPTLFTLGALLLVVAGAVVAGVLAARQWRGRVWVARGPAWALLLAGLWGPLQQLGAGGLARAWMRFLIAPGHAAGLFLVAVAAMTGLVAAVPAAALGFSLTTPPTGPGGDGAGDWRRWQIPALVAACAVCGAWAGRVLLLPACGVEALVRLTAIWAAVLAACRLWLRAASRAGRFAALLAVPVVAILAAVVPTLPEPVTALGFFGRWASRDEGFVGGRLIRYAEGVRQTLTVYEHPDFGRVMLMNGVPVAYGDRYRAGRILASHLPLLLYPEARRVALVGAASAVNLPGVQTHPLEVIDLFAGDGTAARWMPAFFPAGTADPANTNASSLGTATARIGIHHATLPPLWARHAYDLVLLAGGPLWTVDGAAVLQPLALRRCRSALAEDGLAVLQLETQGLTADDFRSIVRRFHAFFPHVQLWCLGEDRWLLVGRGTPIKAPVDRMLEELDQGAVFRDLVLAGVRSLPDILSCYVCETPGIEALASQGGGVSALGLAWHALRGQCDPRDRPEALAAAEEVRSWRMEWLLPGQLDPETFVVLLDSTGRHLATRGGAVRLCLSGAPQGEAHGTALPADDLLIREVLEHLEIRGRRALARSALLEARRCFAAMLQVSPASAAAQYGLGEVAQEAGQMNEAVRTFAQAVQAAPDNLGYRLALGCAQLRQDLAAEAIQQFRVILAREPRNAEALYRLSCALAAVKGSGRDARQAMQLAEQACLLSQWSNAEYIWGLADRYLDAGMIQEGVALKRKLKRLGYEP